MFRSRKILYDESESFRIFETVEKMKMIEAKFWKELFEKRILFNLRIDLYEITKNNIHKKREKREVFRLNLIFKCLSNNP